MSYNYNQVGIDRNISLSTLNNALAVKFLDIKKGNP